MINKGYTKLYRSEADIPQLWESALLFSTYQKLKILADRADWAVTLPVRRLATRMGMSIGTLRKATTQLAEIGLIRAEETADGVSRFVLVFGDGEPVLSQLRRVQTAAAQKEPATKPAKKPDAVSNFNTPTVSNFDTTKPASVSNFNTPTVSNFGTPLYREQERVDNNNTTTPLLFPQDQTEPSTPKQENGFTAFWAAYPNKKSKQRAIKKWNKGKYNLAEILPVLEKQKRLRDWVKNNGQFVPRADAYLNQRRWEDTLPTGEDAYILDFQEPKTQREEVAKYWLQAVSPGLLKNDNQKINCIFEFDRIFFEKIIATCGNDIHQAFKVMVHGWQLGCTTLRAISERAASYLDDLKSQEYKQQ